VAKLAGSLREVFFREHPNLTMVRGLGTGPNCSVEPFYCFGNAQRTISFHRTRYYPLGHDPWEDGDKLIVEEIRAHLPKLSDTRLIREGRAARKLVSLEGRGGRPPRKVFVVGLQECRAEWRRRHPSAAVICKAEGNGVRGV
jgi:hypothetical protein